MRLRKLRRASIADGCALALPRIFSCFLVLPGRLRQHFSTSTPIAGISDDLADEVGDKAVSLRLLDQWEEELGACYAGRARTSVFVALAETCTSLKFPKHEFAGFADCLRQDQRGDPLTKPSTICWAIARYSANPVGHLVLYLCGYRDAERQQLSDRTCTALQLAISGRT